MSPCTFKSISKDIFLFGNNGKCLIYNKFEFEKKKKKEKATFEIIMTEGGREKNK